MVRNTNEVAAANYLDWREQNQAFEDITGYQHRTFNLTASSRQTGDPERVTGARVSDNFFRLLGAATVLGRDFLPEDDQPAAPRVAILSYEFWQSRFGGDPGLLGDSMQLNGESTTVVGILAPDFHLPHLGRAALFTPMALRPEQRRDRNAHWMYVLGRLREGLPLEQGQAEMTALARRLETAYPEFNTGAGIRLVPLQDQIVQSDLPRLRVLSGTVLMVLLIACANVANLLLSRSTGRLREIAVRRALGAGRFRLVRQFLVETLLLFVAGGVLAVLFAYWSLGLTVAGIPAEVRESMRDLGKVEIDGMVLAFTFSVSLLTRLLCGLAPALLGTRLELRDALKECAGRLSEGLPRTRLRSGLVVCQAAVAIMLLVAAGLLVRSFGRILRVDPGFRPQQVLAAQVLRLGVTESQRLVAFYRAVLERIESLPGVVTAGVISHVPFAGPNESELFFIEGRPTPPAGSTPGAQIRSASAGYFGSIGITLIRRRLITDQDSESSHPVALINETMARSHWPESIPIGQRIQIGRQSTTWREIVGVVRDVKHFALTDPPRNQTYLPYTQAANPGMNIVVRTTGDPRHLAGAIRQAVWTVDRNQPISPVRLMEDLISRRHFPQRVSSHVIGLFAALALFLAAIGIYGVLAYSVTQRTHEIGIRVALGASPVDILALVLRHGLKLALAGVLIGLLGATLLTRWLSAMLFGISTADPLTFGIIILLFAVVAMLASYIPARRASRVDPMVALRCE